MQQTVKFYKSPWIFGTAAGRLERDLPAMQKQGWNLQFVALIGNNFFRSKVIITIWVRQGGN